MSKLKELRKTLEEKKKQLKAEVEITKEVVVQPTVEFTQSVYDVLQDPTKKGRHFLMLKIDYNPETGEAEVSDVRPFEDKTAGMAMTQDKTNREYLFNKCKRSEK